jgi:phosphoglycolate phosphatase
MQKVILFDFDGTIADSFASMVKIINILADKYKFKPLDMHEIDDLRHETIQNLFKKLHVPFLKLPLLAKDTKALQMKEIPDIQPIDGIREALLELEKAGYTLGILTSNGRGNVTEFLKKNNLDVFTYFSFDSSLFGKDKVLKRFLKKHKLTNDQVIYVGDEIRDVEASIRAGITMIAVAWGFNSKEGLVKYSPDYLIEKPEELVQVLKKKSL